jgi:hypothetical protein
VSFPQFAQLQPNPGVLLTDLDCGILRASRASCDVCAGQARRYASPPSAPALSPICTADSAVPEIEGVQSQTAKLSAYGALLDTIYSSAPSALTDNLKAFVDAILAESVSLVITRPALVDFVARLDSVKDAETKKQVLIFALEKVHPRAVSFEEQAASIREKLADMYEEEADHNAAYRALSGITLDSGQRYVVRASIAD